MSAKSRLESEKSDLTDLLEKRNREVDRLTGEMLYDAQVSEFLPVNLIYGAVVELHVFFKLQVYCVSLESIMYSSCV